MREEYNALVPEHNAFLLKKKRLQNIQGKFVVILLMNIIKEKENRALRERRIAVETAFLLNKKTAGRGRLSLPW